MRRELGLMGKLGANGNLDGAGLRDFIRIQKELLAAGQIFHRDTELRRRDGSRYR